MAETLPKLRPDLELHRESSESDAHYILKDPIRRQFYRFTPVQAAVLHKLDGCRDPSEIAARASEETGAAVETRQVEAFVEKLRGLLLLDEPAIWAKLDLLRPRKHHPLKNILAIKIYAFNPDAILTRLERKLKFCFTPAFVGTVCLALFAATILSIVNRESLFLSLEALIQLSSIPLLMVVALAVVTVHEFAHGLTLKHYGGKVEEMGLLFLYFIPGFYCNVSDAWMLQKRERVWVTFAGGFIQLFVWSLATIAWRLLSPETFLSRVCLIAIAFSGVQTLFNFNPLIRLDGYYILSDLLGVPNLRSKSFGFIKDKVTRMLLGQSDSRSSMTPGPREKRIFWRYGVASIVFTAFLLLVVVEKIGSWLVREFDAWGVVAISLGGVMALQIAGTESLLSKGRFLAAVMAKIKKTPRSWAVFALLAVGTLLPWELKVSGDFTVRSIGRASVNVQVEGTLRAIHVDQGKSVRKGDILAELENLEIEREHNETKGELAEKQATLRLLEAGTRPEEIEKARRKVDTKQAEYQSAMKVEEERALLQETVLKKEAEFRNAREIFERSKTLFNSGLVSRNDLELDETAFQVRQRELQEAKKQLGVLAEKTERLSEVKKRELEEAKSELSLLQAGTRKESIEEARAGVVKLEEKRKNLEQQVEYLKIRSPIEGVVATADLPNRLGEYLERGNLFCEIVQSRIVWIDMPIPEKEIADVQVGYPIVLKVRGYPGLTFHAEVLSISPVADIAGSERKLMVKSELNNDEGLLKAGMTGVGKILCGKRAIATLLTRRFTRWLRTEFWEYLP